MLPFYYLYWKKTGTFLPHYSIRDPDHVRNNAANVLAAAALFCDPRSQEEFINQMHWRLDPEALALKKMDNEAMYFADALYQARPDEVYVDCGGFDGDTLRDFLCAATGKFSKAFVFEPDPSNFAKLRTTVDGLPVDVQSRVMLLPNAVGSRSEELIFDSAGSTSSRISQSGSIRVHCESIDLVLADESPTFVKMDIEGAEEDAIVGAEATIRSHRPILTVCLYHRQHHLWAIPSKIAALVDGYDYHLRTYGIDGWDLILYAIPQERRKTSRVEVRL